MSVLTRSQAQAIADSIAAETVLHALTPEIVGGFLRDLTDTLVFPGDAETPPTTGNGLTGTNVFSVLPNGSSLDVSASGVRLADIAGLSVLATSSASAGIPAAVTGTDGGVLRISSSSLGFGAIATAGIGDGQVTLPKLGSIATDSLLGRDTAGTGAVENITLNATLSMTGAGALQRSALTGAITATAGSNATTFGSGDFGSLNLTTTGYLRLGLAPGSGTGVASAASTGAIRLPRGGGSPAAAYGRNNLDNADVLLWNWDSTAGTLYLGDASTLSTGYLRLVPNFVQLSVGTNVQFQVSTTAVIPCINNLEWLSTVVTAPRISQAANNSGGAPTGQTFTLQAQSCGGVASTGGAWEAGPGAGIGAGGVGRLKAGGTTPGSLGATRYSWNDTGHAFFAATIAAQVADMGALTDSTGGTANGTLVDVGAVYNQATLNDNFADLAAKVTALRNAMRTAGLMA